MVRAEYARQACAPAALQDVRILPEAPNRARFDMKGILEG